MVMVKTNCDNCKYGGVGCYDVVGACRNNDKFVSKEKKKCDTCMHDRKYYKGIGCYNRIGSCRMGSKFEPIKEKNKKEEKKMKIKCIDCKFSFRYHKLGTSCNSRVGTCSEHDKFEPYIKELKLPIIEKVVYEKGVVKKETERVEKLFKDLKEKRRKRIKKSGFMILIHDNRSMWKDGYKYRFIPEFINYMLSNRDIKKIKKFNIISNDSSSYLPGNISVYETKEWKEFEVILNIVETHYDNYMLWKAKKNLCHITDCYKKLATEKTCLKCSSENPIEAKYCNSCGEKL